MGAREKISQQQERFKAGLIADGVNLDDYQVEPSEPAALPGNKYSMAMGHRKKLQEQKQLQQQ